MLQNKATKIIMIVISILIGIALVAFVAYSIISRIAPAKNQQSTVIDKTAAEKIYKEAADADRTQNYDKAIKQYNEILPFYREGAKTSVTDQNTVWQLETRISSIEKNKRDLQKTLDDQAKQNPNAHLIPEGQGKKPDYDVTEY
jgi:outer membrane protein assembly factor BamD (BamD/ComL family)